MWKEYSIQHAVQMEGDSNKPSVCSEAHQQNSHIRARSWKPSHVEALKKHPLYWASLKQPPTSLSYRIWQETNKSVVAEVSNFAWALSLSWDACTTGGSLLTIAMSVSAEVIRRNHWTVHFDRNLVCYCSCVTGAKICISIRQLEVTMSQKYTKKVKESTQP